MRIYAFWSLMLFAPLILAEVDYHIVGEAYGVDGSEQLLYREKYTPRSDESRAEVHYFSPDNERIARKQLDYAPGDTRPAFVLTDLRQDLRWSAQWDGGELVLQRGSEKAPEQKRIVARTNQVVDAGFDAFIQNHWQALADGEKVSFHFAFPNRLDNIRLRAEMISGGASPITLKDDAWRYFRIRVASALIALFADDLYLAYDNESRNLMVFRGRSNLPDERGESLDVQIRYRYGNAL